MVVSQAQSRDFHQLVASADLAFIDRSNEVWNLAARGPRSRTRGRPHEEIAPGNRCCRHPGPDGRHAGPRAARCRSWRRRRNHRWRHRWRRAGLSVLLRTRPRLRLWSGLRRRLLSAPLLRAGSRLRRRRLLRRWLCLAEAALLGWLCLARPPRQSLWLRPVGPVRMERLTTNAPFISGPEKDRFFSS